jgi:hypothetical protein
MDVMVALVGMKSLDYEKIVRGGQEESTMHAGNSKVPLNALPRVLGQPSSACS